MSDDWTLENLAGISAPDVKWYVLGRGWKSVQSKDPALALFVSPDKQEQLQVPQEGPARDIRRMMADALGKLARFEQRSPSAVYEDLSHPFEDALRLRVQSKIAEAGTLPLNAGLSLFFGGRGLLTAAACSVVQPQAFYPRKSMKRVTDFIDRCRVGQTEVGSYVASILCPSLAPAAKGLFEDLEEPTPFERKVTQKLMSGLAVLGRSVSEGDASLIDEAVDQGVSADLCDALAGIEPPDEDALVHIELSWSPIRPQREANIARVATFAAPDLAFIGSAANRLREKTVITDEVKGPIVSLRDVPFLIQDLGRTVEIRTVVDGRPATVRFGLTDELYRRACDAYRDQLKVRVKGTLRRNANSKIFEMRDVESFEVIDRET